MRWPTLTLGLLTITHFATATPTGTTTTTTTTPDKWAVVLDEKTGEALSMDQIAERFTRRTEGGVHLPLVKRETPRALQRRGDTAAIGLGDYVDVAYSVLLSVGAVTTPLILDTGSSDLWVMSSDCTVGCGSSVPLYSQRTFQPKGLDAELLYGDSSSGTSATGEIGTDTVSLAGLTLQDQYFAAINRTNTSISRTGSSGIFGLGFPINSVVWSEAFQKATPTGVVRTNNTRRSHPEVRSVNRKFPKFNFASKFPSSLSGILGVHPREEHGLFSRQQVSNVVLQVLASFQTIAPLLPRLVVTSKLASPLFTVSLQRNTVDVGGNVGLLSIGEMPPGHTVDELTWVRVRNYSVSEGGIPAPPTSPTEVYPIAWEVLIDDVYLDGAKLPRSNLSDPGILLSALVDTGNSLIRGPDDVVQYIYQTLSGGKSSEGDFACNVPHNLSFSIGGQIFSVDPRDFATQVFVDNVAVCGPNLVSTDPPQQGGYLFSWSLGTPFLKGVLSAYYFGNITYPSQDPPRMGFKSTVPSDANELLQSAVASAVKVNNFPMVSAPAPSGTANIKTDSNGIVTTPTNTPARSSATSYRIPRWIEGCVYPVLLTALTLLLQT